MAKRNDAQSMTPRAQAELLIRCIKNELALGTRHTTASEPYRELRTIEEILECLVTEEGVLLEPVPSRRNLFVSYNQYIM